MEVQQTKSFTIGSSEQVAASSGDPKNQILNTIPQEQGGNQVQEEKKPQVEQEQETTPVSTSTQEELNPGSNGLPTLEELELEEQLQAQQSQEQEEQSVTNLAELQLPDDDNAKAFKEAFNKYLGFDIEDLKTYAEQYQQAIGQLNQVNQQNYIQQSVTNLSNDWNVSRDEVNNRLSQVRERFALYSPEMQARLDNVEGAKLIWSKIENDNFTKKNVPQFNGNNKVSSINRSSKSMFTQKEIDNMDSSEFNQKYSDILYAYQNGLVV